MPQQPQQPQWSQEEANHTLEELKKRSMVDPEFRKLALSNPNAAVNKVNPKPIPSGFSVKFVENTGNVKTIVLPDPVGRAEELSDAELEEVAGGDNNVKIRLA
jgi:aspartate carbamoyltransferase regulatory subunit